MTRSNLSALDKEFLKRYSDKFKFNIEEVTKFYSELKQFMWEDALMMLVPEPKEQDRYLPSNVLSLDLTLGGLPSGITQVYGPPDSYKTALLYYIAAFSKDPLFINADNKDLTFTPPQDLMIIPGSTKANEVVKELIAFNTLETLFVDSMPALHRYESFTKTCIKLMSKRPQMRILISNQTRSSAYTKQTEPALSDFIHSVSQLILAVDKVEKYFGGTKVHYNAWRNGKQTGFYICFNPEGSVDNELYLFDMALAQGVIARAGAYVKFAGDKKNHTLSDFIKNPEYLGILWEKVFAESPYKENRQSYLGRQLSNSSS